MPICAYVPSKVIPMGSQELRRTRLPGGNETLELWEGEQRRVQRSYLLTRRWPVRSHGIFRALSVDVAEAKPSSHSNVDWEFSLRPNVLILVCTSYLLGVTYADLPRHESLEGNRYNEMNGHLLEHCTMSTHNHRTVE